jgi:hypothetical protein
MSLGLNRAIVVFLDPYPVGLPDSSSYQELSIGDAANRECDAEHTSQGFVAAAAIKKAPTICGRGS